MCSRHDSLHDRNQQVENRRTDNPMPVYIVDSKCTSAKMPGPRDEHQ
jgi:hypothetical protein